MRIINLYAKDVKRVAVVDITPAGDIVEIAGENNQGKSTVLDCFWWALAGKKSHQREPIRTGAEEAVIRLDLGEMIVKRTWSKERGTTQVKVYNPVGAKPGTPDEDLPDWKKPQDILDNLLGSLTFDPSAFMLKDERDQFEQLRKIAAVDVDLDALDTANRLDFAVRATVNRDAKERAAQGVHDGFDELPKEKVDESAIVDRLQKAGEHNASIETRKARREQAEHDIKNDLLAAVRHRANAAAAKQSWDTRLAELEAQIKRERLEKGVVIADWNLAARDNDTSVEILQRKLDNAEPLPDPIDPSEIRTELAAAQENNRVFEIKLGLEAARREAAEFQAESKMITQRMEARTQQKMDAISKAKIPIPGLGFGEGYLTYNDLPLEQASDSEKLTVSTEIGMAENPKLRLMRIKYGDQFDAGSMKALAKIAKKNDFQIWVERVAPSSDAAIIMENGMVKSV